MAGTRVARRGEGSRGASPALRKAFLVISGVVSLLVAVGSGLSIGGIHYVESQLSRIAVQGDPGCSGRTCLRHVVRGECASKACNFLILGSDSRAGLSKKQQERFGNDASVLGQRSDTIILVHVDPVHDRTVVLHVPRDLRVEIPGHGVDKINSAFTYGPDVVVQTIERLTGMQVNHYVEVSFAGFQRLVTALGGVRVCVDQPMIDHLSGLNLPKAGCYNLEGPRALAFVRARHVEGDRVPDFSRIARQQQFMRAAISKMLSAGSLIRHFPSIVAAVRHNLVVDSGLKLYDLQDLTRKLSGLGQQGVEFRVVPSVPVQVGGVDYVQALPSATELFRRVRTGASLGSLGREQALTGLSPATITVRVYDGGGGTEVQKAVTYLQDSGFVVLPVQPAPDGLAGSLIWYGKGHANEEDVVASFLPKLKVRFGGREPDQVSGADVSVVVGPDFTVDPGA